MRASARHRQAKKTAATVNGKIEQGKDFIKGKIDDTVDKGIDKVNGVVDPHLDKAVNTFNNSKAGQRVAAANNRAQGIADGLTGFTKSANAKTSGARAAMETATDTLNEFNSANKYGDAFGLDSGKMADGIKGFGSKPAEKETTKESEGKGEARESEKKVEGSGDIAKDLIKTAEKVAEMKGGEKSEGKAENKESKEHSERDEAVDNATEFKGGVVETKRRKKTQVKEYKEKRKHHLTITIKLRK